MTPWFIQIYIYHQKRISINIPETSRLEWIPHRPIHFNKFIAIFPSEFVYLQAYTLECDQHYFFALKRIFLHKIYAYVPHINFVSPTLIYEATPPQLIQ